MAHRSSEVVTELEQEILAGTLSPGERLPSEEKLCERFNVSRTVIREAIQQLRGRGLLRTLKGSGSYIADPSLETLGSALETYSVLTPDTSFLDLIDLRILIESECAKLAATHAGEKVINEMKATLDEMENARGDRETFSRTDIAFHLAVAKGSKNSLYATILAGLERRCIDYANVNRGSEDWYSGVIDRHRAILSAIVDGDPEAASDAMHRHLVLSRRHYVDKQDGA
ncbi:MAG: FadR/GntR family transcriptional regulator [Akkermansiaceae bacterium]|nr:FadR/GntR family transcriptional regulator [Akkermansiaceae bacterium]